MAVYSYKNLWQLVLQHTDEADDTGAARDLAKALVNNAHELRCAEYPEFVLWDTEETLTTVTGQRQYSLHQLFDRPVYFYNQTSKSLLTQIPRRNVEGNPFLANDLTGSTQQFSLWGHNNVLNQPSSSTLSLVSDHTSDTGSNYDVIIKGLNTSGELVAERVTLSGTTPVSSTYTYTKIFSITKERVMNGQLTVTAGSTTIIRLLPDEFGRQYQQFWTPTAPTSPETITYRFYRKPMYLVNDYDIPDIPSPYSKILVYDALLQWGSYNTDTQDKNLNLWKEMQSQWERRLEAYVKEGQALGAQPRLVRSVSAYNDVGPDTAF